MNLSLREVSYRIGGSSILNNITATIQENGIVGVVGPNGSGKSILADVICGRIRPSSGSVTIDGISLSSQTLEGTTRLGVGRMFQTQHLAWSATVEENIVAAFEQRRLVLSQGDRPLAQTGSAVVDSVKDRTEELAFKVRLEGAMEVPACDLSFGQQRLLALAMVVAFGPRLMVLDEPFVGLKDTAIDAVYSLLKHEQEHRIILLIEHHAPAIQALAANIWYMDKGVLTEFSDIAGLREATPFRTLFLCNAERDGVADGIASSSAVDSQHVPTHPGTPALRVRDLTAGYQGGRVIDEINLDLYEGEVLCLIGPNGSGKSTLLNVIVGLLTESDGSIELSGNSILSLTTHQRVRAGIRLLPQGRRVFPSLSVEDNLRIMASNLEAGRRGHASLPIWTSKQVDEMVNDGIERLVTSGLRVQRRPAGTYSGGEQSRIALCEIEYGNPKVILLDEPTSGVDGVAVDHLIHRVNTWRKAGIAVLIVEHNLDFVASVATHTAVMTAGTLAYRLEKRSIYRDGMNLVNESA